MKSTRRDATCGVESLPRKHRQPDSVWKNPSDQTVFREKARRSPWGSKYRGQKSSACGHHLCAHWCKGSGSVSSVWTDICIVTMSTLSAEILAGVTYLTRSRSCAPALRDQRILSSNSYRLSLPIILHIWEIMWSDAKWIHGEGCTLFLEQCTILTLCYPFNAEWRLRSFQFKCRFLMICQRGKWHVCKLNC